MARGHSTLSLRRERESFGSFLYTLSPEAGERVG
jgi:hypothetical protein